MPSWRALALPRRHRQHAGQLARDVQRNAAQVFDRAGTVAAEQQLLRNEFEAHLPYQSGTPNEASKGGILPGMRDDHSGRTGCRDAAQAKGPGPTTHQLEVLDAVPRDHVARLSGERVGKDSMLQLDRALIVTDVLEGRTAAHRVVDERQWL